MADFGGGTEFLLLLTNLSLPSTVGCLLFTALPLVFGLSRILSLSPVFRTVNCENDGRSAAMCFFPDHRW